MAKIVRPHARRTASASRRLNAARAAPLVEPDRRTTADTAGDWSRSDWRARTSRACASMPPRARHTASPYDNAWIVRVPCKSSAKDSRPPRGCPSAGTGGDLSHRLERCESEAGTDSNGLCCTEPYSSSDPDEPSAGPRSDRQIRFLPHEERVLAALVVDERDAVPLTNSKQRNHLGEAHERARPRDTGHSARGSTAVRRSRRTRGFRGNPWRWRASISSR